MASVYRQFHAVSYADLPIQTREMVLDRLFAKAKPRRNFLVRAASHRHLNQALLLERQTHVDRLRRSFVTCQVRPSFMNLDVASGENARRAIRLGHDSERIALSSRFAEVVDINLKLRGLHH